MSETPWFAFSIADLSRAFGPLALDRGRAYAERGAVLSMSVSDPSVVEGEGAAVATVRGSGRSTYSTSITVTSRAGRKILESSCSCPVGRECKHAAALALTLNAGVLGAAPGSAVPVRLPEWRRALAPLLEARPVSLRRLALQVDVPPAARRREGTDSGQSALRFRPLVQGAQGRWVKTGASWRDVSWPYLMRDVAEGQREALATFAAVHQAGQAGSYYGATSDHLSIAEAGPGLWGALSRVVAAGVELLDGSGRAVRCPDELVRASLDLTADEDGAVRLAVMLLHGDQMLTPETTRTVGLPVHGVEYDVGDGLVLAALDRQLPVQLRSIWRGGGGVVIPAVDVDSFLLEFVPMLQRDLPVGSSDASVEVPALSGPRLGLDVTYRERGEVDITWAADYLIGATLRSFPLSGRSSPGWREPGKERDLASDPFVPEGAAGVLTSLVGAQDLLVPQQRLVGIEAARFVNEWLPALLEHRDIAVREHGERPDLRLLATTPEIRLSTREVPGERDWFDLEVDVSIDGESIPLADLLVALRTGETHLFLASGAYFSLDRPEFDRLRRLLDEAAALQESVGRGSLRLSRYQADLWAELVELGVVDQQAAAWQAAVQGLVASESLVRPSPPTRLRADLRPYQQDGLAWLSFLWDHDLGGILADEMGLGKTIQTLALLARAAELRDLDGPALVVAPTSVVHNWVSEAARFVPDLAVVAVNETGRRRGADVATTVRGAAIVVTSYTIFRLEYDEFAALPWRALVLDEAQAVKNPKSKAYQCARRLDARFKLAITGTPLENNLTDLWSQLSIVAPGLFPHPERFAEHFRRPIEREGDAARLATLRRRIRPLILRRTKELVAADLPPRQEQVLEVELHERHRRIYDRQLQRERQKVLGLLDDLDRNRLAIFRSLTVLRQLSLHAALVDVGHAAVPSAKIDILLEQLTEAVAEGHRVLVFSQFTSFLGLVRETLDARQIDYAYLDGRTRNRERVIDRFRKGDAPVFLISLKAGGVGLNLTEADYVFVLDPWWNPAAEAQAVDRAHRLGQTRTVMVYRLVAVGTIEEKVMALKARKAQLFNDVLGGGELESAALTADDIVGLLGE